MRIRSCLCVAALLLVATHHDAIGAGVYKWVDENGKVHYSQKAPSQGGASKLDTPAVAPPASAGGNAESAQLGDSDRDAAGNCRTMKCLADEMEANRLQREKNYARQRADNERAAQKKSVGVTAGSGLSKDRLAYMRTQCLHGLCGSSTRECDDETYLLACQMRQSQQRELFRQQQEALGKPVW